MERTDLLSMLQDNRNQTKKKRNTAAEQVKTERSTKASDGTAASRAAAPSHCMSLRSPRPTASALAMTPTPSRKQGSNTLDLTFAQRPTSL